ncbi:MAG: UDP-N-acetylmuramyl-tripeptide synthetase [Patescibacteria group bacterium]|nr:UDP-N-acetylmuramyl-tripeptide synthetase [Patescibacteria group bacterium]
MRFLKSVLRKFLPKRLFKFMQPFYHGALAVLASYYYGRPGFKMRVVGVTGTAGKSSTVRMLAHILNAQGKKCGFITTVSFHDGNRESLNQHGLSMPGGPLLQKQLALMLKNGCEFAIVECTSEGLAQNRHLGIGFEIGVFTNLYPAHTDAHGGFENYKKAKGKLFAGLANSASAIVTNLDDSHVDYFLNFPAKTKIGITQDQAKKFYQQVKMLLLTDIKSGEGLEFGLENTAFVLPLTGEFNSYNAGLAAAVAEHLGVNLHASAEALKNFSGSAGRMEEIKAGQGFRVFVDYAPEPAGMEAALSAVANLPHSRIIHVFGSTGGHRDVKKRFEFGKISAAHADEIFITNDDVYDSDPAKIASDIETGILGAGAGKKHRTILDRKVAIGAALSEAKAGDIVIITGKGSEQFLVLPGNKRIAWDERQVVRDLLSTKH